VLSVKYYDNISDQTLTKAKKKKQNCTISVITKMSFENIWKEPFRWLIMVC